VAYVNIPNDLSRIKTKVALNLTKRQLICFGAAAVIGVPAYFITRSGIGNMGAMMLMLFLMLPCFFFAMYEKDGLPFEKVAWNMIRAMILWPRVRPYKTNNFYAYLSYAGKEDYPIDANKKKQPPRTNTGPRPKG